MDREIEDSLLDEIDSAADAYGQMPSTEPELFGLGFIVARHNLDWDDTRQLRAGIDRRVRERNTAHSLRGMIESAILNPEFRKS